MLVLFQSNSRFPIAGAAALAAVLACFVPASSSAAETGDLKALRAEALSLVNGVRRDEGLEPLDLTDKLNAAAQSHAEDMLERNYYAHESPEGDTVEDRYREQGGSRWKLVAENIAECRKCDTPPTAERVRSFHQGWINSPPHRQNIVRKGLEGFGFGIVAGDGGRVYAVQTFVGPGTPRGLGADEQSTELSPAEQVRQAVQAVNREREQQGLKPLQASESLSRMAVGILPEDGVEQLFDQSSGPIELPRGVDASRWGAIEIVAGMCGGCGTTPTAADVRYFTNRWLDNPQYRDTLLGPGITHFGLVLRANGEGRKAALAIAGQER